MRTDWVPLSASALVVGVMALVLGGLLNPLSGAGEPADTIQIVSQQSGRMLGMAVMYFIGSVGMTLGLPAVVSLFRKRGQRLGVLAVTVFAVGVIGVSGYAMLLVFFRALVKEEVVTGGDLNDVVRDTGLSVFLYGWIAAYFVGLLLLAVALLVARGTPRWVPIVLLGSVAMLPLSGTFGKVGQVIQLFAMAVAFTGMAISAVTGGQERRSAAYFTS